MLITNNLIEVLIPMKPKANYKWLIGCSSIKKNCFMGEATQNYVIIPPFS